MLNVSLYNVVNCKFEIMFYYVELKILKTSMRFRDFYSTENRISIFKSRKTENRMMGKILKCWQYLRYALIRKIIKYFIIYLQKTVGDLCVKCQNNKKM